MCLFSRKVPCQLTLGGDREVRGTTQGGGARVSQQEAPEPKLDRETRAGHELGGGAYLQKHHPVSGELPRQKRRHIATPSSAQASAGPQPSTADRQQVAASLVRLLSPGEQRLGTLHGAGGMVRTSHGNQQPASALAVSRPAGTMASSTSVN